MHDDSTQNRDTVSLQDVDFNLPTQDHPVLSLIPENHVSNIRKER